LGSGHAAWNARRATFNLLQTNYTTPHLTCQLEADPLSALPLDKSKAIGIGGSGGGTKTGHRDHRFSRQRKSNRTPGRRALYLPGWASWEVETIESDKGSTDFITVALPGSEGRRAGGNAPTLGIIGRLGAIGGRAVMIKWQCWGRIVRPGHRLGLCSSHEAFSLAFPQQ